MRARVPALRAPGRARSAFERGESLAWWAVDHAEPAFIRDNALADPRVKYVPELEEERYQSLLAVPIVGRAGEAIGAITAHTEAPREFTDDEVDFIVTSASLVASAIENARLYEETRLRVAELEQLTELAEAIARADGARRAAADGRRGRTPAARRARLSRLPARPGARGARPEGERSRAGRARGRRSGSPSSAPSSRAAVAARASPSRSSRRASSSASSSPREARASSSAARSRARSRSGSRRSRSSSSSPRRTSSRTSSRSSREGARAATSRAARPGSAATSTSRTSSSSPSRGATRWRVRSAPRAPGSLFDHREDSLRALVRLTSASSESFLERLRAYPRASSAEPVVDRRVERVPGRGRVRRRVRRGAAGARRHRRPLRQAVRSRLRRPRRLQVPPARRGRRRHPRRDGRRGRKARRVRRAARRAAPRDARGVPAPARLDQRDLGGAVRPSEHAAAALAPDRRAVGPRPPARRLARHRDRGEDGEAAAGAGASKSG